MFDVQVHILLQKDSTGVKEALDQLSEVGWAKKWSSQPYVSRRMVSLHYKYEVLGKCYSNTTSHFYKITYAYTCTPITHICWSLLIALDAFVLCYYLVGENSHCWLSRHLGTDISPGADNSRN